MAGREGAKRTTAAQIVEIWQLLGTYYSKEKKDYIDGYSDKAIAIKVNCSDASVRKIRGENFGPIDRGSRKKRSLEERLDIIEEVVKGICNDLQLTSLLELLNGKDIQAGS